MNHCKYCGRELEENEICDCCLDDTVMKKNYLRFAIKRETAEHISRAPSVVLKAIKNVFASFRDIASSGNEDVYLHTADGNYEHEMWIVDECVVPTEKEIVVRQYDIARLKTPILKKAYGRLEVTNKRVIFRAAGRSLTGPIITEKEFAVEEVGGIDIKSDYRFSIVDFLGAMFISGLISALFVLLLAYLLKNQAFAGMTVLSILTYILTILLMFGTTHRRALKSGALMCCCTSSVYLSMLAKVADHDIIGNFSIFCVVVTGILTLVMLILAGIVEDLQISIKVKGGQDALTIARKLPNDERSGFSIVKPWRDTEFAIREIGALIDDIKHFGDAGIDKWKS